MLIEPLRDRRRIRRTLGTSLEEPTCDRLIGDGRLAKLVFSICAFRFVCFSRRDGTYRLRDHLNYVNEAMIMVPRRGNRDLTRGQPYGRKCMPDREIGRDGSADC